MSVELLESGCGTDPFIRGAFVAYEEATFSEGYVCDERMRGISRRQGRMLALEDATRQMVHGFEAENEHKGNLRCGISSGTFDEEIPATMTLLLSGVEVSTLAKAMREIHWLFANEPSTGSTSEYRRPPNLGEEGSVETVDWEMRIEELPPRPFQMVRLRFERGSYRPPRIVDNPEE